MTLSAPNALELLNSTILLGFESFTDWKHIDVSMQFYFFYVNNSDLVAFILLWAFFSIFLLQFWSLNSNHPYSSSFKVTERSVSLLQEFSETV